MDEVERRASRAAESILENESLTADLNDDAAQVLITWGIDCAEMVAQRTVGLDDTEAEEIMAPRLRAIRRLMRLINDITNTTHFKETLDAILEQANIIYGHDFTPPSPPQREAFLKQNMKPDATSSNIIKKLRTFIENPTEGLSPHNEVNADAQPSREESDDQQKQEINTEHEEDTQKSERPHRRYHPRDLWKLLFGNRR